MKLLLILLFSYALAEFDTICKLPPYDPLRCKKPSKKRMRMSGRMSGRMSDKKPAVIHLTSNISSIARFIAYNELIPNANEGNYQNLKQNYMADLAKEAPSFLAYIEIYDDDFRYLNPDESFTTGICTGSLISTQYVLTAGHCLCREHFSQMPCIQLSSGQYVANYDPKFHFMVWIGLTTDQLLRRHKNFEDILQAKFNVSDVFLHPHYRLRGREEGLYHWDTDDIGLIKLHRPICMGDAVKPIR
eukprot:01833.XXX_7170_5969_1 [CDS] Oithona nana genome sequencing.